MEVCLIADTEDHPVLTAALAEIACRHRVRILASALVEDQARAAGELARPADLYLLKSRAASARRLADKVERRGALVVNPPAATEMCLDRAVLARCLTASEVPTPRTVAVGTMGEIGTKFDYPAMVKSRVSRKDDVVCVVAQAVELSALAASRPGEQVIVQEFKVGDGWDYKVWAIGDHMYVARRRSPLETGAVGDAKQNYPVSGRLDRTVRALGQIVGRAIGLVLFGADILISDGSPVVVDVNAFPGFRGVPDAAHRLAVHVEQALATRCR